MRRVALDTMTMIWGLRKAKGPVNREMQKRAQILLEQLDDEGAQILVPTVVLGELLIGVDPKDHGRFVAEIQERFYCPPYDVRATIEAAKLWQAHDSLAADERLQRRVLKADVQVVATAHAAGAACIYSDDAKLRKLAKTLLPAYPLPTHHENMFKNLEAEQGGN